MDTTVDWFDFCFRSRIQVLPEVSEGLTLKHLLLTAVLWSFSQRSQERCKPAEPSPTYTGRQNGDPAQRRCCSSVSLKLNYNSQNSLREGRAPELPFGVVGCGPIPLPILQKISSRRCSSGTVPRLSSQCLTGLGVLRLRSRTSLAPKKTTSPCGFNACAQRYYGSQRAQRFS